MLQHCLEKFTWAFSRNRPEQSWFGNSENRERLQRFLQKIKVSVQYISVKIILIKLPTI